MAKKRAKHGEKSAAVKEMLAADPTASPSAISKALAERGISISPSYVSIIKSQSKKSGKARRKKAVRSASENGTFHIDDLRAAIKFVATVGSVEKAQMALKTLTQLKTELS